MYPRLEFDLPILSIDVVCVKDRITLALADPCPVNADLRLPEFYAQPIRHVVWGCSRSPLSTAASRT